MKKIAIQSILVVLIVLSVYQISNTFKLASLPVNIEEREYANNILSNTIAVYENTVTDSRNDFFIVTSESEFLAEITKDNGLFSHELFELSEGTEKLNDMSSLSMKDESTTEKSRTHFILLPGL